VSGQELGFAFSNHIVGALALIGMGCMFASVIRCPLTSFMIVFEMTHNYTIMLPLMVGNIVAYALSVRWHALSLYDSMLLQDGISLRDARLSGRSGLAQPARAGHHDLRRGDGARRSLRKGELERVGRIAGATTPTRCWARPGNSRESQPMPSWRPW
jgi:hypothetical protein